MANENSENAEEMQAGIQSVEVAGVILQALIKTDHSQRLSEVARMTGLPPAKVHRYLVSLARIGLASQNLLTGRYDLGPMAMQIGLKGFSRFDALRYASDMLDGLVERLGETAGLVVWSEQGPKFVRMSEARHAHASTISFSHICPMTWSATGLLFSSFEDQARTRPLILRELEQNRLLDRPSAPKDESELQQTLVAVRAQGVATVANGGGAGIAGISAPVWDASGKFAMAVTVFAQSGRIDTRMGTELVREVCATAEKLSLALGYHPSIPKIGLTEPANNTDSVPRPQRKARQSRSAQLQDS
ncbi:IclR family transcriptional regulator [Ferrovibrio sp.]|uniref:IclR family transcriptional regulator n=1 Tax=Ferrovibrio sp. TaxID=1917215 RepID=UPI001BBF855D|nr:IclR family transcriptional regulator [Alphaproteobacteria bacterium]